MARETQLRPILLRIVTPAMLICMMVIGLKPSFADSNSSQFAIRLVADDEAAKQDPSRYEHLPAIGSDGIKEMLWVDREVLIGPESVQRADPKTGAPTSEKEIAGFKKRDPKNFTAEFERQLRTPQETILVTFSDPDILERATSPNTDKRAAIVLGGTVLMAPRILEPITGNRLTISGPYTREQTERFAEQINNSVTAAVRNNLKNKK